MDGDLLTGDPRLRFLNMFFGSFLQSAESGTTEE